MSQDNPLLGKVEASAYVADIGRCRSRILEVVRIANFERLRGRANARLSACLVA